MKQAGQKTELFISCFDSFVSFPFQGRFSPIPRSFQRARFVSRFHTYTFEMRNERPSKMTVGGALPSDDGRQTGRPKSQKARLRKLFLDIITDVANGQILSACLEQHALDWETFYRHVRQSPPAREAY